jgi:hypothetical protein
LNLVFNPTEALIDVAAEFVEALVGPTLSHHCHSGMLADKVLRRGTSLQILCATVATEGRRAIAEREAVEFEPLALAARPSAITGDIKLIEVFLHRYRFLQR